MMWDVEHRDFLTPAEVAEMLGVKVETVNAWVREGKLKAGKLPNGRNRFLRADIEAILDPDGSAA